MGIMASGSSDIVFLDLYVSFETPEGLHMIFGIPSAPGVIGGIGICKSESQSVTMNSKVSLLPAVKALDIPLVMVLGVKCPWVSNGGTSVPCSAMSAITAALIRASPRKNPSQ